MRPAVFMDRDDTIIPNRSVTSGTATPGDLFDPALVRLFPGAGESCAAFAALGYALVVVTNQGGIAQGLGTMAQVESVNDRLRELLEEFGVTLDGVYYSPCRRDSVSPRFAVDRWKWRKPEPGMILAAAAELELELGRSWMIGDGERDVEAGVRAGIPVERCIQVGERGLVEAMGRVTKP